MACADQGNSNSKFTADSYDTSKATISGNDVTVTAKPKSGSVVNEFPATFQCSVTVTTAGGQQMNCVSRTWDTSTQWTTQETRTYVVSFPSTPTAITSVRFDPGA